MLKETKRHNCSIALKVIAWFLTDAEVMVTLGQFEVIDDHRAWENW